MFADGSVSLPAVHSEEEFREFLNFLNDAFEDINRKRTRLTWAKQWRNPYDPALQDRLDQASEALYTEKNHETIKTWGDKSGDPFLKRWAAVLDADFTLARLEQQPALRQIVNHISDRYINWRPQIDGQELAYTEQTRILRYDGDRERRCQAWMALWDLNEELTGVTAEMFGMRNHAAQALGHNTYADLKLEAEGVSRSWLVDRFDELEQVTADTFSEYLQAQAAKEGLPDVQPWDIQYLFDRDPWPDAKYFPAGKLKENVFACGRSLGLAPEEMGARIYWYDSPYGGQCVTYAPGDIRILTNQGDGMLYYHTAFHEYGHALHSWYYAQPYTLRRESGMFTEGMAQLMALFLHYPSWLRRTGVPEPVIDAYRETRKLPWMYRHRRIAADVMAELAAWDNPGQDMDQVYGQTTARYLGTEYQPRPFAAVPRWTRPVQMQSYFIADLISTQTHAFLRANFNPLFGSPNALRHVREHYWQPGNAVPWLEKVRRCTGEELTCSYLAKEMTGPLPEG
ncbi:MAG: M3 family metallopeptidase [Thermaerobacterales bacterium]